MSEETVVQEAEEEQVAASQATDAQEENLDELLKEFEATGEAEQQKPVANDLESRLAKLEKENQQLLEKQNNDALERELSSLSGQLRGSLPADTFDDEFMRAFVEGRARQDPRLAKAFYNRLDAPTAWKKVVSGLAKEFQGKFSSLPDRSVSEDAAAVESAVRSASTKTPTTDDEISHEMARKMSDAELEEYLKKHS